MQTNGFKPGMAAPACHCPEPSTHRAGDPANGPAQIETAGALQGTTAAIECQRFDFAISHDVSPEAATDASDYLVILWGWMKPCNDWPAVLAFLDQIGGAA